MSVLTTKFFGSEAYDWEPIMSREMRKSRKADVLDEDVVGFQGLVTSGG